MDLSQPFPAERYRSEIVPQLRMNPLADDLAAFTGLAPEEITRRSRNAEADLMREWCTAPPVLTDTAVRDVYRRCTTGYLFHWAYADRYRYTKYHHIRPLLRGRTLLDYGTASGCMALFASRLDGFAVTAADIDTPYFRFAQFRFAKYGGVTALDTEQEQVPPGAFDAVLLLDVLEHVVDWRTVLDTCLQALAPGGRLILDVALNTYDGGALHICDRTGLDAATLQAHRELRGRRETWREGPLAIWE